MLVNEAKESLHDKNIQEFIKQEQAKNVLKIQPMSHFIQILMALICLFNFYDIVDKHILFIWIALHVITLSGRAFANYYFFTLKKHTTFNALYTNISIPLAFLSAALWGSTVFYIDLYHHPEESFLLMIIIMGISVGTIGTGSYWKPIIMSYLPTIAILYVIGLIFNSSQSHITLAAVFTLFSFFIARYMYIAYYDNIENLLLRRKHELLASSRFNFLATASHDLRQPLQALNLFLSALKIESHSNNHLVDQIEESTYSLSNLLNRILDLSKLDSDSLELLHEPVSLSNIFDRLNNHLEHKALNKGLALFIPTTSVWIKSDPVLFERVLTNLLENAINYTEYGNIEIDVDSSHNTEVIISIKDSGIGMSTKEQLNIFEEFYQISNVERKTEKGLGLGLSIVQKICKLLDIPISLKSKLGEGSTFTLTLEQAQEPSKAEQDLTLNKTLSFSLENKCAVIIDDNKLVRKALKAQLQTWGMSVISGDSLKSVMSALNNQSPIQNNIEIDIILSDYYLLNNQTGIEAIQVLKAHLNKPIIPSIIITGETLPEIIDTIKHQNYTLLHKPIKPAKLRSAIQKKLMPTL